MSAIGDRLKEERERQGLNQEEFGLIGGVKRNAQANYEKGDRSPDADYLSAISEGGADVLYIITGFRKSIQLNALGDDEQEMLAHFRHLSERKKSAFISFVKALLEE